MMQRPIHTYVEGHHVPPSWITEHDHLLCMWTPDNLPPMSDILLEHMAARDRVHHTRLPHYRSNLVRFAALHEYGGIWSDNDMTLRSPLPDDLPADFTAQHATTPNKSPAQVCFMGASQRAPWVGMVLALMEADRPHPIRMASGSRYLNTALEMLPMEDRPTMLSTHAVWVGLRDQPAPTSCWAVHGVVG